jgi:hypothetical protein
MERKYQGKWNVCMMADYCWMLQWEHPEGLHKWKLTKHSFESKRLRFHKKVFMLSNCTVISCSMFSTILIFFILLIKYTIFYCIILLCIYMSVKPPSVV